MVMADKVTIKMQPDISQLRGLLKALNQMDEDSKKGLKEEVTSISMWSANAIRSSGYTGARYPAQAAIVVNTVRGNKDRIPNVTIGGSRGRVSGGANAGQLLMGNEFGSDRNIRGSKGLFPNGGYKFPERSAGYGRGNRGYWIFPTLVLIQPEITRRWKNAVEKVLDNWNKGSGGGLG
jgi:hypothetical protein